MISKKRSKRAWISSLWSVGCSRNNNGIKRTVIEWLRKCSRLKTDYEKYTSKLKLSGRDDDDSEIFDQPEFVHKMREQLISRAHDGLERWKARRNPPSFLTSAESDGSSLCSSKRPKTNHREMIGSFIENREKRDKELIYAIKQVHEEKAKTWSILEKLVDKQSYQYVLSLFTA